MQELYQHITSIVIVIIIRKVCMPANSEWRPMAPAVRTTVTLTIVFFLVYIGVAALRTWGQLTGHAA